MPRLHLYAAGSNSHGQLGIGTEDDAHVFAKCELDADVPVQDIETLRVKICAGANHTLLYLDYGCAGRDLLVAGSSKRGQLGRINQDNQLSFQALSCQKLLSSVDEAITIPSRNCAPSHPDDWSLLDVAAAWETSFFLLENRKSPQDTILLACGSNDFGQLGSQSISDCCAFVPFSTYEVISRINSGPRHTIVVTEEGRVYGWGTSRHGQLGSTVHQAVTYAPIQLPWNARVERTQDDIALGNQHTCLVARTAEEDVVLIGNNRKGQLGTSDAKSREHRFGIPRLDSGGRIDSSRVAVSANWNSTFTLDRSANKLYSFGNNASGQLGRDSSDPGDIGEVDFKQVVASGTILQVASGSEHSLAVLEVDGQRQVWGWGWNEHGNLGRGEDALQDVRKPVRIGGLDKGRIHSVHAGNGTSWIVTLADGD